MKLVNKQKKRKLRSKLVKGSLTRPRIVIFKSKRYLTSQAINDEEGHTLLYLCTADLEKKPEKALQCRKNQEWAQKLGQIMAKKLKEKEIKQVIFDRNGYPYHGKIQAFCDILRKEGIRF